MAGYTGRNAAGNAASIQAAFTQGTPIQLAIDELDRCPVVQVDRLRYNSVIVLHECTVVGRTNPLGAPNHGA